MKAKRNFLYCLSEVNDAGRLVGWASFLVLGLVMALALPTFGQSTFGSVRGTVQDNSGAVIGDAKMVLHSTDENSDRTSNADASGGFVFENVKAGHYTL